MFSSTTRPLLRMRHLSQACQLLPTSHISNRGPQREFSVQAIYSSFPATLLHYSPRQKSSLFDVKEIEQRDDDLFQDAVAVSEDKLVYPGVTEKSSLTNGAVFMPNTILMQELTRHYFDYNIELEDAGKVVESPFIFRIPKGTPITNNLILFHESVGHFSLQPARAMPLEELNQSLDEFYARYAEKKPADQWFGDNPWHTAVGDGEYTAWMSK